MLISLVDVYFSFYYLKWKQSFYEKKCQTHTDNIAHEQYFCKCVIKSGVQKFDTM